MLFKALQANASSINFSCKKLTKIPKLIGKIQSIVQIDLKGNQLNALPDEICNLIQVANIDIPYCLLDLVNY